MSIWRSTETMERIRITKENAKELLDTLLSDSGHIILYDGDEPMVLYSPEHPNQSWRFIPLDGSRAFERLDDGCNWVVEHWHNLEEWEELA